MKINKKSNSNLENISFFGVSVETSFPVLLVTRQLLTKMVVEVHGGIVKCKEGIINVILSRGKKS